MGVYFSQTSVICFRRGFSCCPFHPGVCYSGVSARRELTVAGHKPRYDLMKKLVNIKFLNFLQTPNSILCVSVNRAFGSNYFVKILWYKQVLQLLLQIIKIMSLELGSIEGMMLTCCA